MMEALLQRPFDQIIHQLPFSNKVIQTLVGENTEMSVYLDIAVAFDKLNWKDIHKYSAEIGVSEDQLRLHYNKAMQWSNQII